jgi:hypothetical protein
VRRCLRWSAWLLCLTLLGLARSALAESRISVPDGCGNEEEFNSEIERLTGAPASEAAPASVSIERLGEAAYVLHLGLGDEQRTLHDPECRVLWRSALVIVAAASRSPTAAPPAAAEPAIAEPPAPAASSGPSAAVMTPSATPPPAPPPARPVAVAPPGDPVRAGSAAASGASPAAPRPQRLARPRRARVTSAAAARSGSVPEVDAEASSAGSNETSDALGWGLAAGAGVSGGVVPGLGPALELSALLEVLPWATALSLRYWPERSEVVGGRGVDVSALGGRAAVLFRAAPALDVFAGLELTRLVGTGAAGVSGRNADTAWQLAPTLGVNWFAWDIQYLRIELGVAGRVSLQRPRFVVTGFGDLYRAPALGGDAIIRGVWLFR